MGKRTMCFGLLSTAAMFIWIVNASSSVMGQPPKSFSSQSNDRNGENGAADDKVTQRWIPIDRRKLGELGRLGELLQNPPQAFEDTGLTESADANSTRNQRSLPLDLSKLDLRSLEERLASLSPEQRERLKKLASQLSRNESAKDLSSAFQDLPPTLVDQVQESPALREFAKEVLAENGEEDSTKDSDFLSLDNAKDQPWIKFDPANSALRTEKESQDKKSNTDDVADRDSTGTSLKKAGDGQLDRNRTTASERGSSPNRYNEIGNSKSGERAANQRNAEQRQSGGNQRANGLRNGSLGQSNPNSPRSVRQQPSGSPARVAANTRNQKPETAFDVFRRRVGELGLGQTFEKLAKEAVGIDKSREGKNDNERNPDQVNKEANRLQAEKDKNKRKETPAKKKDSELVQRDPAITAEPDPYTPNQNLSDKQASAQNQSSASRTTGLKPEQSAKPPNPASVENDNSFSSWRAPTWEDLPSFSLWHLTGLLLIVILIGVLVLINRTPEFVRSVAQRRKEEGQRARLMDMEIVNREQVVLAFDTFVTRQLRSFEDWWTSQRVVKHVSDRKMNYSNQLQAAEQVYKNARYSPPDQELSEVDLATVREAIRECVKSRDAE